MSRRAAFLPQGWQPRVMAAAGMAVLFLGIAGKSDASAATFGADLNQPANNPITCSDGWPNQIPLSIQLGQAPFFNTGNASCMWASASATQGFFAPESGTVSAVHVRVGPVTGAMRVVVLRTLYNNTYVIGHPDLACCVIEQYGSIFTPQANTVTTVATDLTMDEQAAPPEGDFEVVHDDVLALEVLQPGVPVPAFATNGGEANESVPDFAWFPSPSQAGTPAPSPDVVSYTGDFSGFQVLMSAEMGGGGGTKGGGGGGGAGNPAPLLAAPTPRLTLLKRTLPIAKGRVALPLGCTLANCIGNVLLQSVEQPGAALASAHSSRRKPRKGKVKAKTITYGTATVDVPAGKSGSASVKLNSAGLKLVKAHKPIKAWANFTLGTVRVSELVTLKP